MIGLPGKWQEKNHRSGWMSNSATTWPLPCGPASPEISVMRSIISMGGSGSWAFPGPNSSPRAQASKSSLSKLVRVMVMRVFSPWSDIVLSVMASAGDTRAKLAFGSIIPSRQGARAQVLPVVTSDCPQSR
ncbi:hypothetical protein FQZ97_1054460 [compost metagenome]